jgi:hypothetical protein
MLVNPTLYCDNWSFAVLDSSIVTDVFPLKAGLVGRDMVPLEPQAVVIAVARAIVRGNRLEERSDKRERSGEFIDSSC